MDGLARRTAFVSGVVKIVRRVLRDRYPSVTFDIVARPFANWVRIDIHWSDGPTRQLVSQLVEATVAAVDATGDGARIEPHTRRTLSENGVTAALLMVTGVPPDDWIQPNGQVSWTRFTIPESQALMDEFTLPERPVSVHHLAALLANRLDLTFALSRSRW